MEVLDQEHNRVQVLTSPHHSRQVVTLPFWWEEAIGQLRMFTSISRSGLLYHSTWYAVQAVSVR